MFDFDVREISDVRSDGGDDVLGFNLVRLDARVTEIPRGPALTLPPETSIATAIEAMRQRRRGSAIVIRNQRPLGVVCDRDIVAQSCGDIDDLRAVPISAVMVALHRSAERGRLGRRGATQDVRAPTVASAHRVRARPVRGRAGRRGSRAVAAGPTDDPFGRGGVPDVARSVTAWRWSKDQRS